LDFAKEQERKGSILIGKTVAKAFRKREMNNPLIVEDARVRRIAQARLTVTIVGCFLTLLGGRASANIALTGNIAGKPAEVRKKCPVHPGNICSSTLVPTNVSLISQPTEWFKQILGKKYSGKEWHFRYVGGNENIKGKFDVKYYRAYNDCPGLLGAKIKVDFVPDATSLIQDILWVQAVDTNFRGKQESLIDDRALLVEMGNLPDPPHNQVMYGPFYPYQDEDEDPPRWQTDYVLPSGGSYDYFYDKPGFSCPTPGSSKYAKFETYAVWWDDYFNQDGTIVDVDNDGHWVYVHEGFSWGFKLACVPEPLTMLCILLGIVNLTVYVHKRSRDK